MLARGARALPLVASEMSLSSDAAVPWREKMKREAMGNTAVMKLLDEPADSTRLWVGV